MLETGLGIACPMRRWCEAHGLACATQEGGCTLSQLLDAKRLACADAPPDSIAADNVGMRGPSFNKDRRELSVHGDVVRTFHRAAGNQISILISFEEQGWPPLIENPLGNPTELDSKYRLSDAAAGLNKHQKPKRIHFWVEKGTHFVFWEIIDEASDRSVSLAGPRGD